MLLAVLDIFPIKNVIDAGLAEMINQFITSDHLQVSYISSNRGMIKPTPVIIDDVEVGLYVDIKILCAQVLRNKYIIEKILAEQVSSAKCHNDVLASTLDCSAERLEFLSGRFDQDLDHVVLYTLMLMSFLCLV